MEPVRIFVYGTLKRGFPNAHQIAKYSESISFKETARTASEHVLITTEFAMPVLFASAHTPPLPQKGHRVTGEIWEVTSEAALAHLDDFEGCPTYYRRDEIDVETDEGKTARVWAYLWASDGVEFRECPALPAYELSVSKNYVSPSTRRRILSERGAE